MVDATEFKLNSEIKTRNLEANFVRILLLRENIPNLFDLL